MFWGTSQGKRYDREVTVAHTSFIGQCFDSSQVRKSLSVGVYPEARAWGLLFRRGGDKGAVGGERAFMCLGGVRQRHSGEALGQGTLKDSGSLKSYNHKPLPHQWTSDAGCSLVDHARQGGPKWLKICLFGLFSNNSYVNFELGVCGLLS